MRVRIFSAFGFMNSQVNHQPLAGKFRPAPAPDQFNLLLPAQTTGERSDELTGQFRRLRHAYVEEHGEYKNPNVWTGEVEAEYINPLGGVSVTNLPYKFNLDTDYEANTILRCSVDWRKQSADELARTLAKMQADLDAAGKTK
jgi:hypothetical protein